MASVLPTAGKYYYLLAKHSGKVLDVNEGGTADGAKVHQWTKGSGDNQKWLLQDAGDGSFYLIAKHSGKVLDVNGGATTDGATITQWTKKDGDNQKWLLQDAGDGYFFLVAKHSSKALDVGGSATTDGATISQWTKHGGDNQKWKFETVAPPSLPPISENGTIKTEAGKNYQVSITVKIPANIGYKNTFGIFAINEDGSTGGVKPGDANYAQTVVKNRISIPGVDEGSYQSGKTFQHTLPGGPEYSVFLIANGTPTSFLEKNPENKGSTPPLVYFFNTAANPDGKTHIKTISSNEYGFEDMYGGGDQDFDDLIVKIETVSV
ncbi:RICIN domain-containing protein [Gloeothece verrucosa]|uniref:Ricin B lectin n=1 Tax=Gloeothece verrucosa (strain PCC 7822) TaxID=497965 RepID=E0UKX4_GLOV7|nr:RICIN domain-containing protein [Gloeothece verrucosa]ADN17604.1 Ricin B lectin [Gloeothece verrucosa PCC 7822]